MRVLVAEDARSLADRVAEGLRDQGMAVDIARDGLEAAAKLDVNAYDVVVLDRDLPGIHGDALCQMITGRDDRVMVLMLTAASAPGDQVRLTPPGLDPVDAVVDYAAPNFIGVRSADGLYRFFGRNAFGMPVGLSHHLFAPDVDKDKTQLAWQSWLDGLYR